MFFEKFETAGTKAGDVKEPAAADELHYDKRWDGEKNVGKFKHWRSDTHSIHRNSNSVLRLPSPPPPLLCTRATRACTGTEHRVQCVRGKYVDTK